VELDLELGERARRVRAVVLDVDGVLTDASLYYGARGESLKRFSARDGFAIKLAQVEGITIAILSGRLAPPLRSRLADLGIDSALVIQGSRDKASDLGRLAAAMGLAFEELAFMGDDLPDLPALASAGLAACPADAVPEVKQRCHFIAPAPGGNGAVRALVELVLRARGRWDDIVGAWGRGEERLRLDRSAAEGKNDG
jgi:3-deoxy-D-manno-octulosonate 8-phosphate phosphatase (KDO 8-P phosphatase)